MNPDCGKSLPWGGWNLNSLPFGNSIESVTGLKFISPEYIMAVTISGEVKKFMVFLLPSFLARKFLLNEVKMALKSVDVFGTSVLSH